MGASTRHGMTPNEECGANHVGEFIRRYTPLILKMQSATEIPRDGCQHPAWNDAKRRRKREA